MDNAEFFNKLDTLGTFAGSRSSKDECYLVVFDSAIAGGGFVDAINRSGCSLFVFCEVDMRVYLSIRDCLNKQREEKKERFTWAMAGVGSATVMSLEAKFPKGVDAIDFQARFCCQLRSLLPK